MKAQDFRALIELLGDLTQVQREALVEALSAEGSSAEVIALIETRFAAAPACGHCGKSEFRPWGRASDLKRYKCKACGRTFNALTGTPLADLVPLASPLSPRQNRRRPARSPASSRPTRPSS